MQTENVCFGDFAEFRESSAKLLVWPFKCTGERKTLFKMSFLLVFIWKAVFTCVAEYILLKHANSKSVYAVFPLWACLGCWGKTEERSYGSASGYWTPQKILHPRKTSKSRKRNEKFWQRDVNGWVLQMPQEFKVCPRSLDLGGDWIWKYAWLLLFNDPLLGKVRRGVLVQVLPHPLPHPPSPRLTNYRLTSVILKTKA